MRDNPMRYRLASALVVALILAAGAPVAATEAPAQGVHPNAKEIDFPWGTFELSQRIIDKAANGEPLNIVVSIAGTAKPVFGAAHLLGTARACERNQGGPLAFNCRVVGPAQEDNTAMVSELETLLASNQVDCVSVDQGMPDMFNDIINRYVDAGVPVMTNTADAANSKRFAYFGINELETAEIAGQVAANMVLEKGLPIDTIAGGSGGPNDLWAQQRYEGFIKGYTSVIPDAKFFNDEKSLVPIGAPNYTVAESVDQAGPFLKGNPQVNLVFHTDQGVEGLGDVIARQGYSGKVWAIGYNVSLPILDSVDAGDILMTVDQGFQNHSDAAVQACVDLLTSGEVPDPLSYVEAVRVTKEGGEGLQTSAEARELFMELMGGE